MSEQSIAEPVLTPEQWRIVLDILAGTRRPRKELAHNSPIEQARMSVGHRSREDSHALWIALHNASLADDDPRKISHKWLRDLQVAQIEAQTAAGLTCAIAEGRVPCASCQAAADHFKARLQQIADALSVYIPPEGATKTTRNG